MFNYSIIYYEEIVWKLWCPNRTFCQSCLTNRVKIWNSKHESGTENRRHESVLKMGQARVFSTIQIFVWEPTLNIFFRNLVSVHDWAIDWYGKREKEKERKAKNLYKFCIILFFLQIVSKFWTVQENFVRLFGLCIPYLFNTYTLN